MTAGCDGRSIATQRRTALPLLLAKLLLAREHEDELSSGLHRWGERTALADARLATLDALLDYSDAIEELSWPVPRSILLQIRMQRILCNPLRS